MKTIIALVATALTLSAESYPLQPSPGSNIHIYVFKSGLMNGKKHDFTFERFQGTLDFDPQKPTESKVSFTLDARSLKCLDDWSPAKGSLDKIATEATKNALQVDRYPEIRFVSDSVQQEGANTYLVSGQLTLRGVTKPATLRVSNKPMGRVLLMDGKAKVKMTDFGIKPPSAALGAVGTKPEMEVVFFLKAGE